MKPHEDRVVAELKELAERREKLGIFIRTSSFFGNLPEDEQFRLGKQLEIMIQYEEVLQDRIDHFPA